MTFILPDLKVLISGRKHILKLVSGLSLDQLIKIPRGYKTNVLWNLGHLNASQQILHYKLSGLQLSLSDEYISSFRKGSSPEKWETTPDIEETKKFFLELPEKTAEDYQNGLFKTFQPYTTSTGMELFSIEDSLAFNNFHEGMHCGIIQCMIKVL